MKKIILIIIFSLILINLVSASKYLIITSDKFDSSLTNLTNLRSNYETIIIHANTYSKETIKGILKIYYNSGDLSDVLIIGDINTIPNGGSDFYYSDINNDGIMEIPVGRIPFDSSEQGLIDLKNWINKLIYYENNKLYNKKNALFIAGDEGNQSNLDIGWHTASYFESKMIPFMPNFTINKAYFKCGFKECCKTTGVGYDDCMPETYQNAMSKFNQNNFIFYAGHGGNQIMPDYYFPGDYLNLTGNNYNIFILGSCSTIQYDFNCYPKNSCGGNRWSYFTDEVLLSKEGGSVAVIGSNVETQKMVKHL